MNAPLLPLPIRMPQNSVSTWLLLIIGVFVLSGGNSWAQGKPLFRVIMQTVDRERIDGILCDVDDSTIFYVPNNRHAIVSLRAKQADVLPISLSMIRKLTIRRKSHAARGALIGLGIGAAGGGLAALALPVDRSKSLSGAINNAFRVVSIGLIVTGGPIYGVLLSCVPRTSLSFRGDTTFLPQTKARLLYFTCDFQPSPSHQPHLNPPQFDSSFAFIR